MSSNWHPEAGECEAAQALFWIKIPLEVELTERVTLVRSLSFLIVATALLSNPFAQQVRNSKHNPDLESLVESERAFAATSVKEGVRASFLKYFAEDGINFQPHPTNTKRAFEKTPPLTGPSPITLNWEPIFADVSHAGDLGYTTGPFTLTDNTPSKRPTKYGYFFSVWKKQPDGMWKVAVDFGVETPAPAAAGVNMKFRPAVHETFNAKRDDTIDDFRKSLVGADTRLNVDVAERGPQTAYLNTLADQSRLHRNGIFPLTDRASFESYFAGWKQGKMELIDASVSNSGDLGYSYGRYTLMSAAKGTVENGYYLRVWRRNPTGDWKIVADISAPTPEEKK